MLTFAHRLTAATDGYFTPTLTSLLESYGYDATLSFKSSPPHPSTHSYSLKGNSLTKTPTTQFDLGGLGKGYLIDKIAKFLKGTDFSFFLINGGGDIYATSHADDTAWHAAIQHPRDDSLAIAQVNLINQSLATSSPSARHFADFHHLLDPKTGRPSHDLLSVSLLAPTTVVADACATAIFVTPRSFLKPLAAKFKFDYLIFDKNLSPLSSSPQFVIDFSYEG